MFGYLLYCYGMEPCILEAPENTPCDKTSKVTSRQGQGSVSIKKQILDTVTSLLGNKIS